MRVLYSTGARFAGGGIGNTSYHAVRGIYRHGALQRLLCGSYRQTEIPADRIKSMGLVSRGWRKLASLERSQRLDHYYRITYDRWAARRFEPCEILLAWSGYSLNTVHHARSQSSTAVLDRALAHPNFLDRLLMDEHRKWGLPYRGSRTAHLVSEEIRAADYVLVPSDFVYESFVAEGEDRRKLVQIPFGVDLERFSQPDNRPDPKPFRALFMGQFSIRKGAPYLLEAWRSLNWPDAELWIAGRNDLAAELRQRFADLRGVRYFGYVPEPNKLFQEAHLFVFPSLAEGSALVTYEALASGLPVITTHQAGSIVRHGQEGFIVPVQDAAALAAHMERLRSDENLQQKMGQAARRRAEEFSWEQYGDNLVAALQKL